MRPHRRSFIGPTSARVSAMHELRLSSTSRSQSSSVICSVGWGVLLPALLTRMSTLPIAASALSASCRTCSRTRHIGDEMGDPHAGARANFGLRGHEFFLMPAGDDDVGTGLGETPGHRLAQALAAPRHEGHASCQIKELMTHYKWFPGLRSYICSHQA